MSAASSIDVVTALETLIRRWYWDPIAFCNDVFPENQRPREWQPEVLAAIKDNPWIAVAACRKAGKTRLAAFIALWFLCTRANSLVVTIAPVWAQVVQSIWTDIRQLWSVSKLPKIFPNWKILTHEIQTNPRLPKWRAIGLASDNVQNLEGRHPESGQPALVIIDESKGVNDAFFSSVQGMLSEGESRLVAIGTPGIPYGWFYNAFAANRSLWFQRQIRADQIPRLAKKCEFERVRLTEHDPFFRQQWLAEFTGGDEGAIIPLEIITPAIGKKVPVDKQWRKICALDVAAGGTDETVLTNRFGPVTMRQEGWQGWDIVRSEHRVLQAVRKFKPELFVIDQSGVGEGTVSHLRHQLAGSGITVIGWRGGYDARDKERFENIKAEEVFALRDRFRDGRISIPNNAKLIGQLCSWTTGVSKKTRTMVVDPEDSPDYADSLMMAYAADRLGASVRGVTPAFLQ
jgi:phage terminase large subunit